MVGGQGGAISFYPVKVEVQVLHLACFVSYVGDVHYCRAGVGLLASHMVSTDTALGGPLLLLGGGESCAGGLL